MLEQVWHCDRCKREIGGDARYHLALKFMHQEGEKDPVAHGLQVDRSVDLCGGCAVSVRVLLEGRPTEPLDPGVALGA